MKRVGRGSNELNGHSPAVDNFAKGGFPCLSHTSPNETITAGPMKREIPSGKTVHCKSRNLTLDLQERHAAGGVVHYVDDRLGNLPRPCFQLHVDVHSTLP